MPDSFPPFGWGSASFDERDLDALLSGDTADIAMGLRPLADALSALRAAPAQAELRGEAAVMAEFSALSGFRPFPQAGPVWDGGQSHTLILPVPPFDTPRKHGARHRSRRGPARPVSWRAGALMSAAAAAVIVVAVAFSGNLSGTIKALTHHSPSASSATTPGAGGSLQGRGRPSQSQAPDTKPRPTSSATAQPQQTQANSLCHALAGYMTHAQPRDWRTEWNTWQQLVTLAGGPSRVAAFCAPYLGSTFPKVRLPQGPHQGGHGYPSTGGQGSDGGQGNYPPGRP